MDTAPVPGLDPRGTTDRPDGPPDTAPARPSADSEAGDPGRGDTGPPVPVADPFGAGAPGADPFDVALFDTAPPAPRTPPAGAAGRGADPTAHRPAAHEPVTHGPVTDTPEAPSDDPSADPAPAAEPPALGSRVRNAARWSLINTVVMRLGNFAAGVVLARFALGPAAWGVYGVAQTVLLVLLSANELGIGLAVVRWEGDVRRFAPTVLTLSTLSSSLFYVVLFAAAPHLASALGSPGATGVLRVMCLCVILDGVSQVPAGILTREFAQGRRMTIDALNFVLSTAVTLVLAFRGWGAMSFAWGSVVGNVAALVGCVLAAPGSLRFGWDSGQARALLRFGLPLAGASLLALGVLNADTLVVGSTLGKVQLGFYVLAFNISGWPVRIISEAARRVSFAGFSRLASSPQALAQGFSRALAVLVTGSVPLCVLLAVLAGPVIHLVYGGRWLPAAGALPWLMALGLVRIGCELAYDCLVAIGRRRMLILTQALWLVVLVPVLAAGAHLHGIVGVAEGHVLVAAGVVVPVYTVGLARTGITPGSLARACAWPFVGGAAMAATAWALSRLLGDGLPALLATGVAAMAAYTVCVLPSRNRLRGTEPQHGRHARPRRGR